MKHLPCQRQGGTPPPLVVAPPPPRREWQVWPPSMFAPRREMQTRPGPRARGGVGNVLRLLDKGEDFKVIFEMVAYCKAKRHFLDSLLAEFPVSGSRSYNVDAFRTRFFFSPALSSRPSHTDRIANSFLCLRLQPTTDVLAACCQAQ